MYTYFLRDYHEQKANHRLTKAQRAKQLEDDNPFADNGPLPILNWEVTNHFLFATLGRRFLFPPSIEILPMGGRGSIPVLVQYDLSFTLPKGCVPRPYPTQAASFPLSKIRRRKGIRTIRPPCRKDYPSQGTKYSFAQNPNCGGP